MFSQNRDQLILTDLRGCLPHAGVLLENTNVLSNLAPLTELELRNDKNLTQKQQRTHDLT